MNERREGGRGRKEWGRKTGIHAFRASMLEINTTSCILAGGRVHIGECVSVCFIGEGGWCSRDGGRCRRRGGREQEESERGRAR